MEFDPDTMKVKICKKCKGLGFATDLQGGRIKCSDCDGTGRIILKTLKNDFSLTSLGEHLSFDPETMKIRVCKSCGGLGSINYGTEERDCADCNGTGRIIAQTIKTEYRLHHIDGLLEEDAE